MVVEDEMSKVITAAELQRHAERILDDVLETGQSRTIAYRGRELLITPVRVPRRSFADVPRRKILRCSFDELVATTWEDAWQPDS